MNDELKILISEYKKHAQNHGKGTMDGNPKLTNRSYHKVMETLNKIKKYNDEGYKALSQLLEENNDYIRLFAATHLLNYNKQKAEKTLQEITQKPGIVSLDAEVVLQEWKNGNLKIP
jgi:Domain of unknown function (DUF2019)